MRYIPPDYDEEEPNMPNITGFNPERIPTTETTKLLRWGTQIEQGEIIDKEFIHRHPELFASVDKFMPLANYTKNAKYQKQIENIRRKIISLCLDADLTFDAEEVVIDTIGDAQYSRGQEGFYTKEQNTLRQKVHQEQISQKTKSDRFSFFKKKEDQRPVSSEVTW